MKDHPFNLLEPRNKAPVTVRALETWIQQAESKSGIGARRLGWLLASSVLISALQREFHFDDNPRFLIKGGAYLELRLGLKTRATKDIDTLFRGDFSQCLEVLDLALADPFGEITFQRSEAEQIAIPMGTVGPIHWPIRLHVSLMIRGRTWRRLILEISPDEAGAGEQVDLFPSPSLSHFGLDTPETTAGIAMAYQVAQKIHACSASHEPKRPNDRVRDVIDLLLLKDAFFGEDKGIDSLAAACWKIFETRTRRMDPSRATTWPPSLIAHAHWKRDYKVYAKDVGFDFDLNQAVDALNAWIKQIDMSIQASRK